MSKPRIAARLTVALSAMFAAARVAIWFVPVVSSAQTVLDDPGVTVDAGATLLHRGPVRHPAGASGTVTLEASLNARGEVTDAHVLSGPDDLRKEALSSVLQWHYSPGLSRVQISMRFEPAARAQPAPGSIASGAPPPPLPPPPLQNARLARIDLLGFSSEAERELRNRLPIHEGDTVTAEGMSGVSAVVKDFDSHARVGFSPYGSNGELALLISISPLSIAAVQPPAPPVPSTDSPAPRRIDGEVMVANRIRVITPVYPPLAKAALIQGDVRFTLIIATDGTVQSAEFVSGHPLLVQAARDAVLQWVYKPTVLNGEAVPVRTEVTVHFTLAQ